MMNGAEDEELGGVDAGRGVSRAAVAVAGLGVLFAAALMVRESWPAWLDGVNVATPWGFVEVVAELPGDEMVEGGVYEDRPGFLHVGCYPPGTFQRQKAWEVARVDRTGAFWSFDEAEKATSGWGPVLTGSAERGGTHLCCGYPQAAAWLCVFSLGVLGFSLRKVKR